MNILVSAVICCFAVYGALHLLFRIADRPPSLAGDRIGNIYTVIAVRNRESSIEGIVRAAAWKSLTGQSGKTINDIVILDLGSEDETGKILERLERDYDFVHVMSREDYINAVREY